MVPRPTILGHQGARNQGRCRKGNFSKMCGIKKGKEKQEMPRSLRSSSRTYFNDTYLGIVGKF